MNAGNERGSDVRGGYRDHVRDAKTCCTPATVLLAVGFATTFAVLPAPMATPAPDGRASLARAVACNEAEDWRCGVEHGARAVELLPGSADAHYAYAVALRQKLSSISFVRAIFGAGTYKRALYRALELDPDHIDARAEEIGFLIRAPGIVGGDKARARRRIAELRALAPREGSLAAAYVLARAGVTDQAVEILESYLAEFGDEDVPGHPTRAEVERRLAEARADL